MALMASLQLPVVLSKLSYLIDNPWNVSLTRANAAGLILADSLMDHNLGKRPVTLLGFSLGSRVIFSCLKELADKGACGLVENVYLFGSPIVASKSEYMKARSVVSGRFVNGYSKNDWILGYLFRATSGGIMRVAGLAPVEGVPHLENVDCTSLVDGHMAYRVAMPRLLRETGWEVLSEEFDEIQDPDPENHQERQRELIREIDAARKESERKPGKKRFSFFRRRKSTKGQDQERETYGSDRGDNSVHNENVLFDTDAMRAELASEKDLGIRQLDTTMPAMKLSADPESEQSTATAAEPPRPSTTESTKTAVGPASPDQRTRRSSNQSPYGAGNEEEQISLELPIRPPQRSYSSSLQRSPDAFSEHGRPRTVLAPLTLPENIGMDLGASAADIEHNVWADEGHDHDDNDDEIHMSFE